MLVEDYRDLDGLERFAFDGRHLYVSEFMDFRSPDGVFRKYRVLVVEGVPYPRHMIASPHWNVHFRDRKLLMDGRPELQDEERSFLATFSPERHSVFGTMASVLGLDYFGVDFALDWDGTVIPFEANCCFKLISEDDELGADSYHAASIDRIKLALAELIRSRAWR